MKKPLKILFFAFILATLMAFALIVCAEESEPVKKQYSVTYQLNDGTCNKSEHDHYGINYYDEGSTITVSQTSCGTIRDGDEKFLGWFSDDGVFYEKGSSFTVTRNTILYMAVGKDIYTASELRAYLNDRSTNNFWNYARLKANITLDNQKIQSNWGSWSTAVLDLNGFNITSINGEYAAGDQRTGLIIVGKGTINFTSNKPASGAFFTTRTHGHGDGSQRFWVGKNVKIVSNVPLIRLTHSMTNLSGKPTIRLYGDFTVPYILWSYGAFDLDVHLYETCKVKIINVSGVDPYPLIRDTSSEMGFTIANLIIHGGEFELPENFKGFITVVDDVPDDRLTYAINGGTFNRDLSAIIPISLRVKDNGDGTFSILDNPCSKAPDGSNGLHKYVAVRITVSCTEDGEIAYRCVYCSDSGCEGEAINCYCNYTVKREAFGHSHISVLTKEMKNTKQETSPAEFTKTCTRCGIVEKDYEFPDPETVYVTLKLRYERLDAASGKMILYNDTIRVKSTLVFGFKEDKTYGGGFSYLDSYSVTSLSYIFSDGREETFKQSEVIGIEIPLGTTTIQANRFKGDSVIEEIYLPESLKVVGDSAFAQMPNLKVITGVEFIQDTIGSSAFAQANDDESVVVLEDLEINAKEIGSNSFQNILTKRLTIGDNVRRVKANAFKLDSNAANYEKNNDVMRELFINKIKRKYHPNGTFDNSGVETANSTLYGISVEQIPSAVLSDLFESFVVSDLMKRGNHYYDHNFSSVTHQPNCISNGYKANECIQCGLNTISDVIPNDGIEHEWEEAESTYSTCSVQGELRNYCPKCNTTRVVAKLPLDSNNHSFEESDEEVGPDACTKTYYYMQKRCSYGCGTWLTDKGDKYDFGIVIGHSYSTDPSDMTIINATCSENGQKISACTRCYVETVVEEIPATGTHSWIRNDSKRIAPSCGSTGTQFYRCTICNAEDSEPIDKLNYEQALELGVHTWEEKVIVEPTKKQFGYKSTTCTICKAPQRGASTQIPKLEQSKFMGMPMGLGITVLIVGIVLVLGGGFAIIYFTLFKKKNKSTSYKYKFNTFKK